MNLGTSDAAPNSPGTGQPQNNEAPSVAAITSGGAERMRRHRQRRKDGLRCLTVELRDSEVHTLVTRGLLSESHRNEPNAILEALYRFLDRALKPG
jgi:hypothetical protein